MLWVPASGAARRRKVAPPRRPCVKTMPAVPLELCLTHILIKCCFARQYSTDEKPVWQGFPAPPRPRQYGARLTIKPTGQA